MASSTSISLAYTKINQKELGTDGGSSISDGRINNKIVNMSSFMKKMHFGVGFFILEASLALTELKKTFIKAPILHHFDLEHHI